MYNPWFQLVASLLSMVMIANLQYAWTLFVNPIQAAHGWKLPEIQAAFSIFVLLQTWAQPFEGWLVDRMGPRVFVTAAGILCGVGWSALAVASSPAQLYFFYAVAGIGAAFVYSVAIGSALKWFPNRRGFAAGIIAAGFGGGTALFIPVISYVIRVYTYRDAFLVTGIVQGVVIAIVAQFLRNPKAGFIAPKPVVVGTPAAKSRKNTENFTTPEILRTPQFYLMYVMFVAVATGGLAVTSQAGPISKSWGFLPATLATATALAQVANGISRIFWGTVSDRVGREITMAVSFGLQSLCLLSVLIVGRTSPTMFVVTLILTYFTYGQVFALFPATLGDYFGGRNATSNNSVLYTSKGVASILAGYVAALLFDRFNSWNAVFYGSAILALISAIGALVLRASPLPKKAVVPQHAVASVGLPSS
jgi:OFA family oxalate/formate antiporter-like MFS transporter